MQSRAGERLIQMPFEVQLVDFTLRRYPGSQSPSSYESLLQLHVDGTTRTEKVYMNNVLDLKGYRFFQASYDEDEMGSILSVSYDTAGRRITYFGYFILFVGLIAVFFNKNSRFSRLARQLKKSTLLIIVLSMLSISLHAAQTNGREPMMH